MRLKFLHAITYCLGVAIQLLTPAGTSYAIVVRVPSLRVGPLEGALLTVWDGPDCGHIVRRLDAIVHEGKAA